MGHGLLLDECEALASGAKPMRFTKYNQSRHHGRMHLESWDPRTDGPALARGAEEGPRGGAFRFDYVVGVVAEGLTGFQLGELTDHSISLHDEGISIGISDDPLAAKDVHRLLGIVVDGDVVNERVRAIRWGWTRWIILDLVHGDGQTGKMLKTHVHIILRLRAEPQRSRHA